MAITKTYTIGLALLNGTLFALQVHTKAAMTVQSSAPSPTPCSRLEKTRNPTQHVHTGIKTAPAAMARFA